MGMTSDLARLQTLAQAADDVLETLRRVPDSPSVHDESRESLADELESMSVAVDGLDTEYASRVLMDLAARVRDGRQAPEPGYAP